MNSPQIKRPKPKGNVVYWSTILITFVVFAVAMTGMAIGVIVSNRRIRGSCGGLGNLRFARQADM
ncbi:MAG: (Na+)-NQR maturation NqrM [Planctomycetes bacterium]|nr:(Na+)-NQR maturation NqrM [Planctomycetota bacterium]